MHLPFGELRVSQHLFHGLHTLAEIIHIQIFKTSSCNHTIEVNTIIERVYLKVCLSRARESAFCSFTGCAETTKSSLIVTQIFLKLALKLLYKVLHKTVIKVFTS
mmetsp:Transcript_8518/g.8631  ORF Transcript_8518/g.8631 Transcript_8518/m.8631 type:complete len:105 (+) Transcript_8518:1153-1467(+)